MKRISFGKSGELVDARTDQEIRERDELESMEFKQRYYRAYGIKNKRLKKMHMQRIGGMVND